MKMSALLSICFSPALAVATDVFGDIYDHMRYLNKRDKIIAQNIQNVDTPGYKPKELYKRRVNDEVRVAITHPGHMSLDDERGGFFIDSGEVHEIKPNGNAVNLDAELYRKGENSTRLSEVTNVYGKAKSMLNSAILGPK
jgi:flagellar basal-body rod protein FlgB